ncbi:hypothetical protein [Pseudomonas sp.]|uniref:hypothetical protein n=1 Tax=Pseudomonas sp. TaxID=306 RepID=UPI00261A050C|nr:hypothetical protein [Pseudomonas sp.]
MQTRYCEACGKRFQPRSQTPHQAYCSELDCQRVRRLRWQRDKRKNDPDYADNQARAQQAWSTRNADYWKNYRATHPDYVEQNRNKQRVRDARDTGGADVGLAKMDASNSLPRLSSGLYRMQSVSQSGLAKMDVWTVELQVLSYSS